MVVSICIFCQQIVTDQFNQPILISDLRVGIAVDIHVIMRIAEAAGKRIIRGLWVRYRESFLYQFGISSAYQSALWETRESKNDPCPV